jgi:hypothetical protein
LSRLAKSELLAWSQIERAGLACGQLEDGLRAALCGRPPGRQLEGQAHDTEISVEPHGVDGEAHEERVDGGGGTKKETFASLKPVTPEQAPHTSERCLREEAPFADNSTVLTFQDCGH